VETVLVELGQAVAVAVALVELVELEFTMVLAQVVLGLQVQ
jgi:hypothetical protein